MACFSGTLYNFGPKWECPALNSSQKHHLEVCILLQFPVTPATCKIGVTGKRDGHIHSSSLPVGLSPVGAACLQDADASPRGEEEQEGLRCRDLSPPSYPAIHSLTPRSPQEKARTLGTPDSAILTKVVLWRETLYQSFCPLLEPSSRTSTGG